MRIFDGKEYRDMTEAEMQEHKKQENIQMAYEKSRPLTENEVLALLIPQQINTLQVDDNTALRMVAFYPTWEECVKLGTVSCDKPGYKFQHGGKLYSCVNANPTFQAAWVPGVGTESLYVQINETHAGTMDDPIPYDGNMALVAGLYYMQDYVIYLCTRDTGNPVYNPLAELVGIYVETV